MVNLEVAGCYFFSNMCGCVWGCGWATNIHGSKWSSMHMCILFLEESIIFSFFFFAWVAVVPRNLQPRWCLMLSQCIQSIYPPRCPPSKIPSNLSFICSRMCFLRENFPNAAVSNPNPFNMATCYFYIQSPFSFVTENGVLLESDILMFMESGFLFYIHHNSKIKK